MKTILREPGPCIMTDHEDHVMTPNHTLFQRKELLPMPWEKAKEWIP